MLDDEAQHDTSIISGLWHCGYTRLNAHPIFGIYAGATNRATSDSLLHSEGEGPTGPGSMSTFGASPVMRTFGTRLGVRVARHRAARLLPAGRFLKGPSKLSVSPPRLRCP